MKESICLYVFLSPTYFKSIELGSMNYVFSKIKRMKFFGLDNFEWIAWENLTACQVTKKMESTPEMLHYRSPDACAI